MDHLLYLAHCLVDLFDTLGLFLRGFGDLGVDLCRSLGAFTDGLVLCPRCYCKLRTPSDGLHRRLDQSGGIFCGV